MIEYARRIIRGAADVLKDGDALLVVPIVQDHL
jgi:hypothetical protein